MSPELTEASGSAPGFLSAVESGSRSSEQMTCLMLTKRSQTVSGIHRRERGQGDVVTFPFGLPTLQGEDSFS